MLNRPRILLMVTADRSVNFYRGFATFLHEAGWDVHVSASPGQRLEAFGENEACTVHPIQMDRNISLLRDARSLFQALRVVRRVAPDIVCAGTPKAGLVGMVASWIGAHTLRVYQVHGLRLETSTGPQRALLTLTERIACRLAHRVLAVSNGLSATLVNLRLTKASKIDVAGMGSANGVDVARFASAKPIDSHCASRGNPVLGFIGRMHEDKGVPLLADALRVLSTEGVSGTLLVIGPDDSSRSTELRRSLDASGWDVVHVGQIDNVEQYLPLIDVVALPTLREGFPTTVLEAGAAGVPVVATAATGIDDALVDGVTGVVVRDRSAPSYAAALKSLITDEPLRARMGKAAYERVAAFYSREHVWNEYERYFRTMLQSARY